MQNSEKKKRSLRFPLSSRMHFGSSIAESDDRAIIVPFKQENNGPKINTEFDVSRGDGVAAQ